MGKIKVIDTAHYHLWTDALHARELARQARNRWDRGTYVRWTVTTAWTVLEMACEDALTTPGIGRRFKENLDAASLARGATQPDWGSGVWQQVALLHGARKEFVHINADQTKLFLEVADAEHAVSVVRDAVTDVYRRAGKAPPMWLNDDQDRGWDYGRGQGAHIQVQHAGADPLAPDTIRIAYVYKDKQYVNEILPPNADYNERLNDLIRRLKVPVTAVRAYRGEDLILEKRLQMRGA